VAEHIATITLNRPNQLNAMNAAFKKEIRAAMAAEDEEVRVIVLTGTVKAFSTGNDMKSNFETGPNPWKSTAPGAG
jgi:enoyl-CoA hydratase/carnithine racemase